MPNAKIDVDDVLDPSCRNRLPAARGPILDMVCHDMTGGQRPLSAMRICGSQDITIAPERF